MGAKETHPSDHWREATGISILDPDGWDRSNFAESWAEPITLQEFLRRAAISTSDWRGYDKAFWA